MYLKWPWTIPDLFHLRAIWSDLRTNMYWNWSWKFPDLSYLGPIWPKLTSLLTPSLSRHDSKLQKRYWLSPIIGCGLHEWCRWDMSNRLLYSNSNVEMAITFRWTEHCFNCHHWCRRVLKNSQSCQSPLQELLSGKLWSQLIRLSTPTFFFIR